VSVVLTSEERTDVRDRKGVVGLPRQTGLEPRRLAEAVGKLYECAGVCVSCADACSGEQNPQQIAMAAKCMRMDHDCADLCTVTARVLTRQTGYDAPTTLAAIEATCTALGACADACAEMQHMQHCRVCAHRCRETAALLGQLADEIRSGASASGAYPSEPPSATTPAGAEMSQSQA
jgi:Na+-translocating ferredoxin:NAD+ oxidoreductase RnfC subunit